MEYWKWIEKQTLEKKNEEKGSMNEGKGFIMIRKERRITQKNGEAIKEVRSLSSALKGKFLWWQNYPLGSSF